MYQFKINKEAEGGYRFELGDIIMLVEDYNLVNNNHLLINPNKAIAYFNIEQNIYGVCNEPLKFDSAEKFYDAISRQYEIFTKNPKKLNNSSRQNLA